MHYFNIFTQTKKNTRDHERLSPIKFSQKKKNYAGRLGHLHYKHLLSYIKEVLAYRFSADVTPHLIYITHSKDLVDFENFSKFLNIASDFDSITFSTTRNYVNSYLCL